MKAILSRARISTKKANIVADLVRGKKVADALDLLKLTPKKAALLLYKTIKSAASNAEKNFNQDKDQLYIKEIVITEGPVLKRYIPASKGRAHPILKRTCHIIVRVEAK